MKVRIAAFCFKTCIHCSFRFLEIQTQVIDGNKKDHITPKYVLTRWKNQDVLIYIP